MKLTALYAQTPAAKHVGITVAGNLVTVRDGALVTEYKMDDTTELTKVGDNSEMVNQIAKLTKLATDVAAIKAKLAAV